jgi:2-polyprenyl-6-hydroxyphenyl methylase/3-demethylubiquinone-9 3-methyltransferase
VLNLDRHDSITEVTSVYAFRSTTNFNLIIKKRGNESGASQYHSQLASLLHFVAQPSRPGRVVLTLRRYQTHERRQTMAKNVICLWYNGTAEDAARFYAQTFPDSAMTAVHRAPGDYPDGKQGQVLTIEFTVLGVPCLGLNGGPAFKHSEAFSFQIVTDNQAETDRYWNAIVNNGGTESACGWCKDRWGLSWQITPRTLLDATTDPDRAAAKRAFEAMMKMQKIDIAVIEAARRGTARA